MTGKSEFESGGLETAMVEKESPMTAQGRRDARVAGIATLVAGGVILYERSFPESNTFACDLLFAASIAIMARGAYRLLGGYKALKREYETGTSAEYIPRNT